MQLTTSSFLLSMHSSLVPRVLSFSGCLLLVAMAALPIKSYAQTKPASPSQQQLARQFRDGFMRGCTPGKTNGVRNQANYCNCLAASYLNRYDGNTLAVISQLSGTLGENGAKLVNVMIAPEAKACAAKS